MNICFFGVGGVGGYYGALLTRYFNETGKGNIYLALLNEYSYDRLPTTITTIQEESLWLLVQNVVAGIVKKTALSKNDSV
ncbi:MAG: hypothetical protein KJ826_16615, partial [Proteobacteria bacterium]|nr:hypothetical protein [Pseudomonadota bacterium]